MGIKFSVTKVKEIMTEHPVLISPETTLQEAANKMKEVGCGALPIGTESKLLGMITDRDIVVRAIANGKDPAKTAVKDFISEEVFDCLEEDTIEQAAEKMHQGRVSRLVVKNNAGKVTGILSFGTVFRNDARPEDVAAVVKCACGPVSC